MSLHKISILPPPSESTLLLKLWTTSLTLGWQSATHFNLTIKKLDRWEGDVKLGKSNTIMAWLTKRVWECWQNTPRSKSTRPVFSALYSMKVRSGTPTWDKSTGSMLSTCGVLSTSSVSAGRTTIHTVTSCNAPKFPACIPCWANAAFDGWNIFNAWRMGHC